MESGFEINTKTTGFGSPARAYTKDRISPNVTRLIIEKINLPNLVIIDGARPQLNVAIEVLKSLDIFEKLDVISISKNRNHRADTIHLTNGNDVPIGEMFDLAKILDEVHRFTIEFHRTRRSKTIRR